MHHHDLRRRLVLALDMPEPEAALALMRRTREHVGTYKVGLELFSAAGPAVVEQILREGAEVFLDLKLHDIPSTVAAAVREAARLGVSLLTLHALGGPKMMGAAAEALASVVEAVPSTPTRLLGVSVLTHHTSDELAVLGLEADPVAAVLRLTQLASASGLQGCVCSAEEAARVRASLGDDFVIVCPGIRPAGAPLGDQSRVATPYEAIRAGATYLVVGRPIRNAADPAEAAAAVLADMIRGASEGSAS
ncbi:MAG: orotidine-5'-phosphate decarboxylase [Myxococcota bacterium]